MGRGGAGWDGQVGGTGGCVVQHTCTHGCAHTHTHAHTVGASGSVRPKRPHTPIQYQAAARHVPRAPLAKNAVVMSQHAASAADPPPVLSNHPC